MTNILVYFFIFKNILLKKNHTKLEKKINTTNVSNLNRVMWFFVRKKKVPFFLKKSVNVKKFALFEVKMSFVIYSYGQYNQPKWLLNWARDVAVSSVVAWHVAPYVAVCSATAKMPGGKSGGIWDILQRKISFVFLIWKNV